MSLIMNFVVPIILQYLVLNYVAAEDILGCGGFIKSHTNMDFSKVEVKLFTKQGSLRERTDCSPTGYYFLPLYDRGEYVLKIVPPAGWSFEPNKVTLNVDGKTDLCSLGKDINFVFKGFGITGQVETLGHPVGPQGVKLELLTEGVAEVRETVSSDVGSFYFTPVFPGKYTVKASHPRYSFVKSQVSVTVTSGNTELPIGSLVVGGYDVRGSVISEGASLPGIYIAVVAEKTKVATETIKGCSTTPIPGFASAHGVPICHVKSEANGKFYIQSLPPGSYKLIPHYHSSVHSVQYIFSPEMQQIEIAHSGVSLSKPFEVIGVTVPGKVLTAANGKGIKGAEVFVDGKSITLTDYNGKYILQNIKSGGYTIQIKAAGMQFSEHNVAVTLKNPVLSDIVADSFQVCGHVVSNKIHSVKITRQGGSEHVTVETNPSSGEWCTYLPSGKYQAEVLVNDLQKAEGLQFFPISQLIEVGQSPVSGIVFSQLKAVVSGSINCLAGSSELCKAQEITLKMMNSDGNFGEDVKVSAVAGKYSFKNILPGTYEVSLSASVLCWEKDIQQITVTTATHQIPAFQHTGYSVTFDSSHKTTMSYALQSKPQIKKTVELEPGTNSICVQQPGAYIMSFSGCHTYSEKEEDLTFNTEDSPKPVEIEALTHIHGIHITSPVLVKDLYLNIKFDTGSEYKVGPIVGVKEVNGDSAEFVYSHAIQVAPDNYVQVTPFSESLLFNPKMVDFVGSRDCKDKAVESLGRVGRMIEGQVIPAIEGVKITVEGVGLHLVTETDEQGRYRMGPIDGSITYKVSADKTSYILTGPDNSGNFKAHKLCEVIVTVIDQADDKPLHGVLLSLSGGEGFRKNLLTDMEGTMIFSSLLPSEYYLRPVMKEYVFEPNSKMVKVREGETVKLEIRGKRTAFSAFGTITSLNGEPTANVEVEAVGQGPCSQYTEEAITEQTGIFRVRGLQPKCAYLLRVKKGAEFNKHIDRWTPHDIKVEVVDKDVEGLKIIVFHPITHMDVTAHIMSNNVEHYRSLKVKLCRDNLPDSPVHSVKLENPGFNRGSNPGVRVMFPRIPADGRTYFLQIESSLSPASHSYNTMSVQFTASGSFKHIRLEFNATAKATEQDLNQNSMLALPMIILVSLVFFNQQKTVDIVQTLIGKFNNATANNKPIVQQSSSGHNVDHREIEQIVQNINAVKRKVKPKKI